MRVEILSLFPAYFRGPLDESILKRAQLSGILDIHLVDIRKFSTERYQKVDDRPYGGGPGMVLMAEPVVQAIRSCKTERSKVIYLSPQGKVLDAAKSRELAQLEHVILVCGHYEGIDERAIQLEVDEELSIGDYVLTNGCLASLVLLDAMSRFIPGVLGDARASSEDSFEEGLLDCPHYTRPEVFEGLKVPDVLLSGDHTMITQWRRHEAQTKTKRARPELWTQYLARSSDERVEAIDNTSPTCVEKLVLIANDIELLCRFFEKAFRVHVDKGEGYASFTIQPLYFRIVEDTEAKLAREETTVHIKMRSQDFVRILRSEKVYEEKFGVRMRINIGPSQSIELHDPSGHKWIITEANS